MALESVEKCDVVDRGEGLGRLQFLGDPASADLVATMNLHLTQD